MEIKTNHKKKIRTKPEEFELFHKLLLEKAPLGYTPWYIPITEGEKYPDGKFIFTRSPKEERDKLKQITDRLESKKRWRELSSWTKDYARLNYSEALIRLINGGNVALAAMKDDPLILADIDDHRKSDKMPSNSLIDVSRKRYGYHGYFFKKPEEDLPDNTPTPYGELRVQNQFVLIPGSYVKTTCEDIMSNEISIADQGIASYTNIIKQIFEFEKLKNIICNDENLGNYTVLKANPARVLERKEIPDFYLTKEANLRNRKKRYFKERQDKKQKKTIRQLAMEYRDYQSESHSRLYELKIGDLINLPRGFNGSHPIHGSTGGMNFSLQDDGSLAHCWRHCVSLNAIQYLNILAGHLDCERAGTPHNGGSSIVSGDNECIFTAWKEAKIRGYIPEEDPIPVKAMMYLAEKHNLPIGTNGYLSYTVRNQIYQMLEDGTW